MSRPGFVDIGRELWGRFSSSDPGLNQLRLSVRALISVIIGLLVGDLLARATGQPALIPVLLCAVLSLNIAFTVADPTAAGKAVTMLFMPVPLAIGMTSAALLSPHHTSALIGFVLVMFFAVYIRRFGPRFFAYGMVGWMTYFLVMFTGLPLAALPPLMIDVAVLLVVLTALQTLVFRNQPDRVLGRMKHAFRVRLRAVADASLELIEGGRPQDRRRLRARLIRLNEVALLIDGQLAVPGALPPGRSEELVRGRLLAAELAAGAIGAAAERLAGQREATAPAQLADVREALVALRRGRYAQARAAGERLVALGMNCGSGYAATAAAYRLGAGVIDLTTAIVEVTGAIAASGESAMAPFTPSVTLFNGNLPGAAAIADQLGAQAAHGLRGLILRMRLTTRQALQVAVASGLAVVVGSAISERRYYWAVLACFLAFTGTATAAETVSKAVDRALGTLVGIGLAIVVADLTKGNTVAVMAVILVSIVVGFFLMRFSYALAVVFITTMVAQLYVVLDEFSDDLLLLRLLETSVGAIIGCLVALCFLPTSTRKLARLAERNFLTAEAELLADTATLLRANGPTEVNLSASARAADASLQQLFTITQPWRLPKLFGAATPFPGILGERRRTAMYSMLAEGARSLARTVHDRPALGLHLAMALAEVSDDFAARATALAEHRPVASTGIDPARELETIGLTLRSWYGATGAAPQQILAHLRHLDETLTSLDRTTGHPTAVPAPDSTEPTDPATANSPAPADTADTAGSTASAPDVGPAEPATPADITTGGTAQTTANTTAPRSAQATAPAAAHAATPGSAHATTPGSAQATAPGSAQATAPGSAHVTAPAAAHTAGPGSAHASASGSANAGTPADPAAEEARQSPAAPHLPAMPPPNPPVVPTISVRRAAGPVTRSPIRPVVPHRAPLSSARACTTPAVPTSRPAASKRPAANGGGVLRGVVYHLGGYGARRPLPSAALTLIDHSGHEVGRTVAGPDGRYTLTTPTPGAYLLVCTPPRTGAHHDHPGAPRVTSVLVDGNPLTRDVLLSQQ